MLGAEGEHLVAGGDLGRRSSRPFLFNARGSVWPAPPFAPAGEPCGRRRRAGMEPPFLWSA